MNPAIDISVSSVPETIPVPTTTVVQPQSHHPPSTSTIKTLSISPPVTISTNTTTNALPIRNSPGSTNHHYTAFSSGDPCPANILPSPPSTLISINGQFNQPTVDNTPRSHSADPVGVDVPSPPPPIASPTAAELLHQRLQLKEEKLNEIKNQCSLLISELDSNQDPEAVVKKHISQLQKYNELKDIALDLVRLIAEQRHVKTSEMFNDMDVDAKAD